MTVGDWDLVTEIGLRPKRLKVAKMSKMAKMPRGKELEDAKDVEDGKDVAGQGINRRRFHLFFLPSSSAVSATIFQ